MDVGHDQEDCTKRYVRTQGEVQRGKGNSDAALPSDDGMENARKERSMKELVAPDVEAYAEAHSMPEFLTLKKSFIYS